jgi:hypothetical protein
MRNSVCQVLIAPFATWRLGKHCPDARALRLNRMRVDLRRSGDKNLLVFDIFLVNLSRAVL